MFKCAGIELACVFWASLVLLVSRSHVRTLLVGNSQSSREQVGHSGSRKGWEAEGEVGDC